MAKLAQDFFLRNMLKASGFRNIRRNKKGTLDASRGNQRFFGLTLKSMGDGVVPHNAPGEPMKVDVTITYTMYGSDKRPEV